MSKALMIQGTSSYCGKSLIVAALCKIFANLGYKVAPFKAQNMSLNSFVTKDNKEIARAQALQALAAGVEPLSDMNPILLKPKGDNICQIILHGKPYKDVRVGEYYKFALNEGIKSIELSLKRLMSSYELVIIEGAGSPAEINLYDYDIANMKVAELINAPVLLIGDIDRGGVFASIVGTLKLLKPKHRALVKGLIINKFRGDRSILEPGLKKLEEITGKQVLGVIPYIHDLQLPSEDSISLEEFNKETNYTIDIVVIRLPYISNFTDFEPFKSMQGVRLRYVNSIDELNTPDILILPGTKNTIHDLIWLQNSGLSNGILRLANQNIPIIGICGGYQMLGKMIIDKEGIEGGVKGEFKGLNLLNIITYFDKYDKVTEKVFAEVIGEDQIFNTIRGERMYGAAIHMGLTIPINNIKPSFRIIKRGKRMVNELDGSVSDNGLVIGTYIHGIFDNSIVREALIKFLMKRRFIQASQFKQRNTIEIWNENLERLAKIVKDNLDMKKICELINIPY
ncbi:MAG: cobyric acid synthase [Nitrososphaerales archaeon]